MKVEAMTTPEVTKELADRVVVMTGSGRGCGHAIAHHYGHAGGLRLDKSNGTDEKAEA